MYRLVRKTKSVVVDKLCVYCGTVARGVHSATVNCSKCKKRGLRSTYGVDLDGAPYTVESGE